MDSQSHSRSQQVMESPRFSTTLCPLIGLLVRRFQAQPNSRPISTFAQCILGFATLKKAVACFYTKKQPAKGIDMHFGNGD